MQKTLIDPFELAAQMLPGSHGPVPPKRSLVQTRKVEPADLQPNWAPRGEAWSRVRCWCSEE